ncbi:MAG: alpha/beta fold hydrolase [Myxococcales bacterium]|nr:alpha/beta fold hydrolase [Myxococcales bacterium]
MWWMWMMGCAGEPATDETDTTSEDTSTQVDTGTEAFETTVGPWSDCGRGTECATLEVPLQPGSAEGLELWVRRLLPPQPATRALWFVDGGPGDPGTRVVPDLGFFHKVFPNLAIYALDQRGSGASTPLGCEAEEAAGSDGGSEITESEWSSCIASLDPSWLQAFGTRQAADDLALAIDQLTPELDNVVWGLSYGTLLVQRYLEQHPDQPEAVILDGLVPPDWTFAEFDGSMDATGRDYLARCDADPTCAEQLGGDAVSFAEDTLAGLAQLPCAGVGPTEARAILGALLLQGDDRGVMPAVLARLARCDTDDQAAMATLLSRFGGEPDQSQVLLAHISSSELMPPGTDPDAAGDALSDTIVATGAGAWVARRAAQWPAFERPAQPVATTDRPVLMLHGGLDPTVTMPRVQALLGAYPRGQSATPPSAGHVTLNFSDCAVDAYLIFLDDPTASVPGCTEEVWPEVWGGSPLQAQRLFGTSDPWGG